MNKSKFNFFDFSMKQTIIKLGVCFLFAFFFSSLNMNAQGLTSSQSLVGPAAAEQLIDQEIATMNIALSNLASSTEDHAEMQAHIYYYEGAKRQLQNNASTNLAVDVNLQNLSKSRDTHVLDNAKTWYQEMVLLLSN